MRINLELLHFLANVGVVVFGVLAVVCGLAVWQIGDRLQTARDAATAASIKAANDRTARLREQIAPRQISTDALHRLVDELRKIEPKVPVRISGGGDAESMDLANQFSSAFHLAGWTSETTNVLGQSLRGQWLRFRTATSGPPSAIVGPLVRALAVSGFQFHAVGGSDGSSADVELLIGVKPPPD